MLIACHSFSLFRCRPFFYSFSSFFDAAIALCSMMMMLMIMRKRRPRLFLTYRWAKRIHRLIDPSPFYLTLSLSHSLALAARARVQISIAFDVCLEDFFSLSFFPSFFRLFVRSFQSYSFFAILHIDRWDG